MSLIEQLRQKIAEQATVVEGWRLAKLNASDGMAFSKRFADVPADAPFEQLADAYAFLLSKSIVTDGGQKELDTDEGRALLLQLERELFCKLGEAAIAWNIGEAKKN